MAACSEQELEGKSTQEKRLLCSKSFDSTTNKEDAFNTQKACNSEMSELAVTVEPDPKNTVDIGSLTEEQLQSLLEEATTFNRPKDEASSILRALRKQIKDSDNVQDPAPQHNPKRKVRTPCQRGRLLLGHDDTLMVDYSNFIHSRNNDSVFGAAGRHAGREFQSQSLQDLASARFTDTHDPMRAAGIGRGNRRLQKAGRANSFTEHSSEWAGLGAQMSSLDRTQGRSFKSKARAGNRSSWTGQVVVNTSEGDNPVGISPSAVKLPSDPYALFNDCEYDVSSGESFGGKVWSGCSSDSSSPDKEQVDPIPLSSCDTNDSGISLLSCRPLNDEFEPGEKGSPNEIEMIDMAKSATFGEVGDCGTMIVCKGDGYSDVDAPVMFPLKSASSVHNAVNCRPGSVNGIYELQDRYCSVQSIIAPGDDIRKEDFKIYQTVDVRPTSFFNSFGMAGGNYSFDGPPTKNELTNAGAHVRKMKRTKSNAESSVKRAEDCDGYRGEEDIDTLLEFINSADKSKTASSAITVTAATTTTTTNNNNNANSTNKCSKGPMGSVLLSVPPRLPGNGLDSIKVGCVAREKCHRVLKKKEGEEFLQPICNSYSDSDSDAGDDPSPLDALGDYDSSNGSCDQKQGPVDAPGKFLSRQALKEARASSLAEQNAKLVSSFAKDFYSVTDLGSQLIEESEFRVVVNKQRKRKQAKKPDGFRRYGNNPVPAGVGSGGSSERDYYLQESPCHHSILLSGLPLSHRTQRGQSEFNRRKSTSSMPPSEPSSADNSDLDSVHSLPVVGTAPPPTQPHPHTTPSSMSSTPQASYADIARMATQATKGKELCAPGQTTAPTSPQPPPSSSPSSTSSSSSTTVSAAVQTQDVMEAPLDKSPDDKRELTFPESSLPLVPDPPVLRTPSPICEKPREPPQSDKADPVPSAKPATSSSSRTVKQSSPPVAARPNKSVSPSLPPAVMAIPPVALVSAAPPLPPAVSATLPPKPAPVSVNQPAAVIAAAASQPMAVKPSASGHRFLQESTVLCQKPSSQRGEPPRTKGAKAGPAVIKGPPPVPVCLCDISFGVDMSEILGLAEGSPVTFDFDSQECSSRSDSVVVVKGKKLLWQEREAPVKNFNHSQVVSFFGTAWDSVLHDFEKDSSQGGKKSGRVCYYSS